MIGGLGLLPSVPDDTWLIGAGVITLGLNLARTLNQLRVSTFSIVLGIAAIALGIARYTGIDVPVFPLLLIMVGLALCGVWCLISSRWVMASDATENPSR